MTEREDRPVSKTCGPLLLRFLSIYKRIDQTLAPVEEGHSTGRGENVRHVLPPGDRRSVASCYNNYLYSFAAHAERAGEGTSRPSCFRQTASATVLKSALKTLQRTWSERCCGALRRFAL